MKTNFEKLFIQEAKPFKDEFERSRKAYEKFLKSFITSTVTGKKHFKEAYEESRNNYEDFGYEPPSEIDVMEHLIQFTIFDFEYAKKDDPIANKHL